VYNSKLRIIAAAARNKPLLQVLTQHPGKVIQYITRKYNEIASQKTMLVSIMAVYRLMNIKAKAKTSYDAYLIYFDKLDAILRDRSKTNIPSKRQAAGFITHEELQLVRKKLPVGSMKRLLLSFYGGCVPPVRNDLHCAFVHMLKCKEGKARDAIVAIITPNCILLPYDTNKEGALILREFKTQDRANPKLYSRRLGMQLSDEVRVSLQKHPRDYLSAICLQDFENTLRKAMHSDIVMPLIHLAHACLWSTQHQRQRRACPRHVSFNRDTSPVSIYSQI